MKIYLYLSDKIRIFTLPQMVSGSYNFDEFDNSEDKLINIDAKDNKWILHSTEDSKVYLNNQIVQELPLLPYNFYRINKNNTFYVIYVEKLVEETFNTYSYDRDLDIILGNTENSTIVYKNIFEKGDIFQITSTNNTLVLDKFTSNRVYVNYKLINGAQRYLNPGDIINYYGFKILLLKDKLLINNPNNTVFVDENRSRIHKTILPHQEKLENLEVKENHLYKRDDYFSKSPRIRRIIETKKIELTAPPQIEESSKQSTLLTLGPMFTMALTSIITLGNVGQKMIAGDADISNTWPQLATATVMIISAILWPVLSRRFEKKMAKARKKESKRNIK